MKERTLALAGLMQGLKLAQRAANGEALDHDALQATLASVFRIDADSVEAVYGSPRLMQLGLTTLVEQFNGARDSAISRMGVTVLHIERQLSARPDLMAAIGQGINDAQRQREHFGIDHATVIARLADLYANNVSHLPTRVLVTGEPVLLRQESVVIQIRANLLAAIRSAVLWRQLRGSWWDLAIKRRAMVKAAQAMLDAGM